MRIFVAIPAVPGGSTFKGFEGQIEADSFSLEVVRPPDAAAKPRLGDVVITKSVDKASMLLGDAWAKGTRFPKAVVTFVQESGANVGKKPLVIELANASVRSVENDASAGGAASAVEKIAFAYASATLAYATPTGALVSTLNRSV